MTDKPQRQRTPWGIYARPAQEYDSDAPFDGLQKIGETPSVQDKAGKSIIKDHLANHPGDEVFFIKSQGPVKIEAKPRLTWGS